jgi:DNA-binding IclR family transcriptional regulator
MPDDAGSGTIRSVDRALDVLSEFSAEQPVLTLKELCIATDLPRTTMLRVLAVLQERGMVTAVGAHEYAVGPGMLRWASLASARFHLPAEAQAALSRLVEQTDETASIYVRAGTRRICIAQTESSQALRHVGQVGRERPLWTGAAGRVLLSELDDEALRQVARQSPTGEALLPDLQEWRATTIADGFAATHNERGDGLSIVAVPIHGPHGRISGALSTAGPTVRFAADRIPDLRAALDVARDAIEGSTFPQWIGSRDD